jgi:hypothetical protein
VLHLQVLWVPLSLIPLKAPFLSSIIWGWYDEPFTAKVVTGLSHPAPIKKIIRGNLKSHAWQKVISNMHFYTLSLKQ